MPESSPHKIIQNRDLIFVQYVEALKNDKKFQKIVVKRLSLWYLNESGEKPIFYAETKREKSFVEKVCKKTQCDMT